MKNIAGILLLTLSFLNVIDINNAYGSDYHEEKNDTSILGENYYLIGPGDILLIKFFGNPEFDGEYKILPDGKINLPLIGSVNVENLNLNQVNIKIRDIYSKELLNPNLFITTKTERPILVSVVGEVKNPGIYSITSEENFKQSSEFLIKQSGYPSLIDALRKAGGITLDSDLSDIKIKRRVSGEKDNYKIASFDLLKVVKEGSQINNPYLFDGDVIYVQKAKFIDSSLINLAKASLSPKKIKVNIIGEVQNPGVVELNANVSLSQAVAFSGGPKYLRSNKSNVQLISINSNGTISSKRYSINLKRNIKNKNNPSLSDGDIIVVNPNSLEKISKSLGVVTDPLSKIITAYSFLKIID